MNEQQYRLVKALLFAVALTIAGIYVWGTRFAIDDGYVIDKWTQKIYTPEEK